MELMNNMKIVLGDILKGKRRAALGGHIRPDGDCIGSCLGLYMYLKEQYPEIETDVYLENVPEAFRMISCTDEVKTQADEDDVYDLFICLDCGDQKRLGFAEKLFENAKETLCIDHHVSNGCSTARRSVRGQRKRSTWESPMIPACFSIPAPRRRLWRSLLN